MEAWLQQTQVKRRTCRHLSVVMSSCSPIQPCTERMGTKSTPIEIQNNTCSIQYSTKPSHHNTHVVQQSTPLSYDQTLWFKNTLLITTFIDSTHKIDFFNEEQFLTSFCPHYTQPCPTISRAWNCSWKKKRKFLGGSGGMAPGQLWKSRPKSVQFEAFWRQIWRNIAH